MSPHRDPHQMQAVPRHRAFGAKSLSIGNHYVILAGAGGFEPPYGGIKISVDLQQFQRAF